jgi:Bacterial regulatory helix-turn-helix protein, lysR family
MENIYMHLSSRLLSGVVTFVTVVDVGSFRGAARPLGVTPSGVSRGVSRLEEQLCAFRGIVSRDFSAS